MFMTSCGKIEMSKVYMIDDTAVPGFDECKYCKTKLRRKSVTLSLCVPCEKLYQLNFIRKEVGKYVKNTNNDRRRIKSDLLRSRPLNLDESM